MMARTTSNTSVHRRGDLFIFLVAVDFIVVAKDVDEGGRFLDACIPGTVIVVAVMADAVIVVGGCFLDACIVGTAVLIALQAVA